MVANKQETYRIMEVCILAGKIMLQNGAETHRVEDTMLRMALAFGAKEAHSYVTPTGIFFSIKGDEPTKTKLIRIDDRTTDLNKISQVNSISRKISNNDITVTEAFQQLKKIDESAPTYSMPVQTLAAAIASGCFLIIFKGSWFDFPVAFIAGGIGLLIFSYAYKLTSIKFFAEFIAAVIIGIIAIAFVRLGYGLEIDKIIIGAVMPLVPGLLLTNAVRDVMAGHLVSGISKGAEALFTAFAIGSGIAVALIFI